MKSVPPLESLILSLRHQKVILDADLAGLYGVPTKALNQALKRNLERFPEDFCFQLTLAEWEDLNRSHFVTGSQRHRDPRFLPRAFTEHGALMAANVLNSPEAVKMSVYVMRAFIKQREILGCCLVKLWKEILACLIGNPYSKGVKCLPKEKHRLPRQS